MKNKINVYCSSTSLNDAEKSSIRHSVEEIIEQGHLAIIDESDIDVFITEIDPLNHNYKAVITYKEKQINFDGTINPLSA